MSLNVQPTLSITRAERNSTSTDRYLLRSGRCPNCRIYTHEAKRSVTGRKLVPLTNEFVFQGRCLACHPLPAGARPSSSFATPAEPINAVAEPTPPPPPPSNTSSESIYKGEEYNSPIPYVSVEAQRAMASSSSPPPPVPSISATAQQHHGSATVEYKEEEYNTPIPCVPVHAQQTMGAPVPVPVPLPPGNSQPTAIETPMLSAPAHARPAPSDPSSRMASPKPSRRKEETATESCWVKHKVWIVASTLLVVVAAVAIGVGLAVGGGGSDSDGETTHEESTPSPTTTTPSPPSAPSPRPTPSPVDPKARKDAIRSFLLDQSVSSESDLDQETSSQGKAMEWIASEDELVLDVDDQHLIQRYTLAVLYYSLGGENWTVISGTDVVTAGTWLTADHECSWFLSYGSENWMEGRRRQRILEDASVPVPANPCDNDGFVTEIVWGYVTGSGTIPSELAKLERLEYLDLSENDLTGTIPTELSSLGNLQVVNLYLCQLDGTIPTELAALPLKWMDLDSNSLSGQLPNEFGTTSSLELLYLDENSLGGTLPPSWGSLTKLQELELQFNSLTGTIPDEWGGMTNLTSLHLNFNDLVGDVLSSHGLCKLSTLEIFQADCLGDNGEPAVTCSCCTYCCNDLLVWCQVPA